MSLRLQKIDAQSVPQSAPGPQPAASISGWLGVLATMLPRRQAESIREELETHLRDRVRDLMVGGLSESEATKRAIAELGEAAELAGKYRALASEPRRRIVMYGTLCTVAGAALALSIAAISGGQPEKELAQAKAETEAVKSFLMDTLTLEQPEEKNRVLLDLLVKARHADMQEIRVEPRLRVYDVRKNQEATLASQPESLDFRADVKFDNTTAADVLKFLEEKAKMPVVANWDQLSEVGLPPDSRVNLRAKEAGPDLILRALNEATGSIREAPVDWRVTSGVLEVRPRDYFDKREVKLVIYDMDGIIAARQAKYDEERSNIVEEIVKLVTEFVYPDGWQENGGDLAKMTVVGDRMFVEAPERFHKQIKWMLEQLPSVKGQSAAPAAPESRTETVRLKAMDAKEALALIGQAMNISPGLGTLDGKRVIDVSARDNAILLKTSDEQARAIKQLLRLIDLPEGEVRGGPETRAFKLSHTSPRAMREFLGRAFNVSPGLKQCAVPRVMSCDESDKVFELTATPDQVEVVANVIALVDRRLD